MPFSIHRLGLDEARGVQFLHTGFPAPLIHRDLKSPNLLITQNWTLKVSDFGLSRFRHSSFESLLTGQVGTFQWMAPEVIENKSYNESADVYSFGVNLWELATRRIPYQGLAPVQVAVAVTARGERPSMDAHTLDESCPPELCVLIGQCWRQDPAERPSFEVIIRELKRIAADLPDL
jgi:serine/threonine protein kinase